MKVIDNIKNLIASNKVDKALELLNEFLSQTESETEAIILKTQYENLEKEKREGRINFDQYSIHKNNIISSLLKLLEILASNEAFDSNSHHLDISWIKFEDERYKRAKEYAEKFIYSKSSFEKEEYFKKVVTIYLNAFKIYPIQSEKFISAFDSNIPDKERIFKYDNDGFNLYSPIISLLKNGIPSVSHFYGLIQLSTTDLFLNHTLPFSLSILKVIEDEGYKSGLEYAEKKLKDEYLDIETDFPFFHYIMGHCLRKNNFFFEAIGSFKRGINLIDTFDTELSVYDKLLLAELHRGLATVFRKLKYNSINEKEKDKCHNNALENYLKASGIFESLENASIPTIKSIGSDIYFSYGYFLFESFFSNENVYTSIDTKKANEIIEVFDKSYKLNNLFVAPLSRIAILNMYNSDWDEACYNFLIVFEFDYKFLGKKNDNEKLMTQIWNSYSLLELKKNHPNFKFPSPINNSFIDSLVTKALKKNISEGVIECHTFDMVVINNIIHRDTVDSQLSNLVQLFRNELKKRAEKKLVIKSRKIRVLLVGFGEMGKKYHYSVLTEKENTEICGIVKEEAGEEIKNIPIFYSHDLDKAILSTNPDLVIISTPHYLHFDQTKIALNLDCHVLVEKPLSLNFSSTAELLELAKKKNKLLVVNLQRRYEGAAEIFRRFLKEDKLGKITFVNGLFSHQFDADTLRMDGWRLDPNKCGAGIIDDSGYHLIDLLIYFSGGNINYSSLSSKFIIKDNIPHTFSFISQTENGVLISGSGSYISPNNTVQEEISIFGTKGSLFIRRFKINWNTNPPDLFYKSFDGSIQKKIDLKVTPSGRKLTLLNLIEFLSGNIDRSQLYTEAEHVLETHMVADLIKKGDIIKG